MRGGRTPRGAHPSSGDNISVWPSNWNHKGRDGQRRNSKGGAGSASSSWTAPASRWGGRENESDNFPRSVLSQASGVGTGTDLANRGNCCAGDAGGEFSGAEIVTGAEPLEVVEFDRKSPSPNDSDVSQMTDCSGCAPDEGAPSGCNSLSQKCSAQVRCTVAGSAALAGDLAASFSKEAPTRVFSIDPRSGLLTSDMTSTRSLPSFDIA